MPFVSKMKCKNEMQYSKALCLNIISSDTSYANRESNDLEKLFIETSYIKRDVQINISRTKIFSRGFLLEKETKREEQKKKHFI